MARFVITQMAQMMCRVLFGRPLDPLPDSLPALSSSPRRRIDGMTENGRMAGKEPAAGNDAGQQDGHCLVVLADIGVDVDVRPGACRGIPDGACTSARSTAKDVSRGWRSGGHSPGSCLARTKRASTSWRHAMREKTDPFDTWTGQGGLRNELPGFPKGRYPCYLYGSFARLSARSRGNGRATGIVSRDVV